MKPDLTPSLVAGSVLFVPVLYALAHRFTRIPASGVGEAAGGSAERLCRTLLIALNAAANLVLLGWLGAPIAIAGAVAGVNLSAALPSLGRIPAFSTILGCTSLAMPMSWPATAAGIAAALLDAGGAALRPRWERTSDFGIGVDPRTLTVIVRGGVLYLFPCGYNLGNVVFIHDRFVDAGGVCEPALVAHETGHTLNVAAFGSVFHFVGAFHQNLGPPAGGAGARAYAELLAESRRRAPDRPWLRGWPPAESR